MAHPEGLGQLRISWGMTQGILASCAQNIGLPDSLLSRFDLLFIFLDSKVERAYERSRVMRGWWLGR